MRVSLLARGAAAAIFWLRPFLAAALGCATGLAQASQEPLWEVGLGLGAIHFPQYRGSEQTKNYVLPTPYFTYRGEFLKADREGARGVFFRNDNVDLHMSV